MLIRPNNHKSKVIVLSVLLLSITAFLLLYFASRSWAYRYYCFKETAVEYAKSGDSVMMGTLFDFDWDEVYSDRGVFSEGEILKQKYGLSFHISRSSREDQARLLFFRVGKLIEVGTYPKYYLTIPSEADKLLPTTKVQVSFGPSEKILVLTPCDN